MQDRVAEVLLERQTVGGPNRAGILISAAVHAAAFLMFIISPHTSPSPERARVITMRLAPSGGAPKAASPAGATRAQTQPRATPAPEISPVVPPPPAPTVAPRDRVLDRPVRTDPARTGERSVFGTSGKPAPAATAAPAPRTAPAGPAAGAGPSQGSGTFAEPGVGTAGVTGLEGGDFPYNVYIDRMTTRIGEQWARPRVESELITRVYFIIERDGRIRDARIEQASGNGSFDRAALRAVIQASPLPPLPGQYSGRYLGVHLTFH